jgi:hypothetical protein
MEHDIAVAQKEEKLNTPFKVKADNAVPVVMDVDTTKRIVTGLYNTYNYFDSDCDVLLPGCSLKSIQERGPMSAGVPKIKHALFHDLTKLPGKILTLEEREVEINGQKVKGLYFETQMSSAQDGVDTLIKYQEGIYDNHSIGFRYLQLEFVDSEATDWLQLVSQLTNPDDALECGCMYLVKEINLYEGSTVSFGANSLTPYLGCKSKDKALVQLSLFERMDRLNSQIKKGTLSDDAIQDLKIQFLQIKQMVKEMFEMEPFVKPTVEQPGEDKSAVEKQLADRFTNFLKQI